MPSITRSGLREAAVNLVAAATWLAFATSHLQGFARTQRASLVLFFAVETSAAVLFLLRARAERTSSAPGAWLTAIAGTFAPMLLRPVDGGGDVLVGQLVQCAGGVLALWGMASLGRSFGVIPALRGLRVGGAYRVVRHPLYAAYTIQGIGYLVSHPSPRNATLVAAAFLFQLLRIGGEEGVLASAAGWDAYRRRTRWRLLPLVY